MKQRYSAQEVWMRAASKIATLVCLVTLWNFTAAFAQSSVIHIYASGTFQYVGAAGLKQALLDVAEPGTIYVHSGTYDLGATTTSFLTISKAVTLIGFDDGTGKPVIKGARPSGISGVVFVNAPGKAVVLDNLEISYYGTRAIGTVGFVVQVQGSQAFTVQHCKILGAFFDGTLNRGIYGSIGVGGPPQSEFPVLPYPPTPTSVANPNYPLRNSIQGEVSIRDSALTGWISALAIGIYGPVNLDKIEVVNCTLNALGATQYGAWNKGDVGIGIVQYPVYMTDANRAALIGATHAETRTAIRHNTISVSNPIGLIYVKGRQWIEKNRLHSLGAWFYGGGINKYIQRGILALGYPHDVTDSTTYSEVVIRNNVIALQVPSFPIQGSSFTPPQTIGNTSPVTGIWLGASGKVYTPLSTITGHHAKATVTGNVISTQGASPSSPSNPAEYGLSLQSEMKNCVIAGNHLAGGWLVDPIDGRAKRFEPFTAKVAQLYVGPEAHDNYFGPVPKHKLLEDNVGATEMTNENTEWWAGHHLPGNAFGPAGIVGVLCYGQNNQFRENRFLGDYTGWLPGDGPGLFWLTDKTYGNQIVGTRLNRRWVGFDLCRQIYDETDLGWPQYQGLNFIAGYRRCLPKSEEFVQRMQTLKAEIEARQ